MKRSIQFGSRIKKTTIFNHLKWVFIISSKTYHTSAVNFVSMSHLHILLMHDNSNNYRFMCEKIGVIVYGHLCTINRISMWPLQYFAMNQWLYVCVYVGNSTKHSLHFMCKPPVTSYSITTVCLNWLIWNGSVKFKIYSLNILKSVYISNFIYWSWSMQELVKKNLNWKKWTSLIYLAVRAWSVFF